MQFDSFLKQALPQLGYHWKPHRRRAVRRKILQRVQELHLDCLENYLEQLQKSGEESDNFRTLLPITVSRFFRNQEYFEFLRKNIFPEILPQFSSEKKLELKIWSAGAAAGEEAYSIAMVWDCWFTERYPQISLSILATDIDPEIMERGKRGVYRKSSLRELPKALLQRYFQRNADDIFILEPSLKSQVQWKTHDLRQGPPLPGNHLIFCCYSAFTYFAPDIQNRALRVLANSLIPKGYLIIGKKELLPSQGKQLFRPFYADLRVYKKFL